MEYIVIFLIGVIFVLFITIMIVMNFFKVKTSQTVERTSSDPLVRVDDLNAFVRKHPHCVVMVHAEWCSHCKNLRPLLSKVAAKKQSEVMYGTLDGPENSAVLDAYQIQGFPTLLRFYNGNKVAELRGMQTEEALSSFVKL